MIVSHAEVLTYLGIDSTATDAQRALVTMLHKSAERAIKRYCRTCIEQATFTEYLPPDTRVDYDFDIASYDVMGNLATPVRPGISSLQLSNVPVRSITSVYEDAGALGGSAPNAFPAESLLTEGAHYYLDSDAAGISRSGRLVRVGAWSVIGRSVKVTYIGGYSGAELNGDEGAAVDASDIRTAVIQQIAAEYNKTLQAQSGSIGGITSERLGDYAVTYDSSQLQQLASARLLPATMDRLAPFVNWGSLL